jgi:5-methylcytosine-specific restriction endonuclease McrA
MFPYVTGEFIKKEKQKARELKKTRWWRTKRSLGVCYYCGGRFDTEALTLDHVIPLSKGGMSVRENIVIACKECNNKKKYNLPYEWEEYMKSIEEAGR